VKTKLEPMGQRVIVKRLSRSETKSGLILTDDSKRGTFFGPLLKWGPKPTGLR
jgi:co-chaperonin GroES (HSP10)